MNSYEEGRIHLENIGIDIKKITNFVGDSLFSALNDVNVSVGEINLFVSTNITPISVLETLGLNFEYFSGKKILDLGGGFGGMPFVLENYVDEYVLCDPCFENTVKNSALEKTISIENKLIVDLQKSLKQISNELNNLQTWQTAAKFKYNDLLEQSDELGKIIFVKKVILDYLNMRKNFNKDQHPKIIINSSKGEDIQGIVNESQDVILIGHILDKKYLNYNGILAEASRVLKSDGEILIVEDADKEMREILLKLGLTWDEKYSKIICRIKKTS